MISDEERDVLRRIKERTLAGDVSLVGRDQLLLDARFCLGMVDRLLHLCPAIEPNVAPPLYAWIGEDELGSGEVGIKQGLVPAGYIPLVSIDGEKIARQQVVAGLRAQADQFTKTIRLVRYVPIAICHEIVPS